ncbi:hypothetical protein ACFSUS_03425 [Spirosoma soli]|uniref:DUF1735 domain-containing protein n=1 Tax=Spirosoma soli TaxID=1770529 RepID=A0ABW5LY25_9BACT
MKNRIKAGIALLLLVTVLLGCTEEEVYKELPKAVYIANKVPDGTANLLGSTSARKTVAAGAARVYVNQPYDKDVTVNFTLAGTAIQGQDYTPPATQSVTIPAGKYSAEINFTVLNNPNLTANRTVIINLTAATEGFELGLGVAKGYATFTYTITP